MRQPLVLIPSQLCNQRVWRHQITHLGDIAEVHVADQRGHDSMAAIAASVLSRAPGRFSLAGHGMGGFVAFEMLRQAPERIIRLALFSTFAAADGPAQRQRRAGYTQLVEQGHFEQVIEQRIPILFHPDIPRRSDQAACGRRGRFRRRGVFHKRPLQRAISWETEEESPSKEGSYGAGELLSIARRMALETGPDGFLRQQQAILTRIDSTATLAAIDCPTLIVTGRQDAICSPDAARELAAGIRNARLVVIENCGHLMPLEQPVQITALLRDWLEGRAVL